MTGAENVSYFVGLSAEQLALQPLAGALFAFEAPAAGLPAYAVALA